ncbi:hypothetical protein PTKIN_Ptkin06aG0025900 [Pterospermum kingtungense]
MENSPTVIRSPPPLFASSPPLPLPDNATNSTIIGSPPPPPPPLPFSSSPPQVYPIDQNATVTIVTINPPPYSAFPADSPRSVDLSPLEFILALMAVITIPAIVYAFFFAARCPPWTSRERGQDSRPRELPTDNHGGTVEVIERRKGPVSGFKYQKETHSKDVGPECPVCLSVFADGEEVKQLSVCNHSFHGTCIDLWLNNNNNCPICRASVAVKRPNNNRTAATSGSGRGSDLHQGLPDAASLV